MPVPGRFYYNRPYWWSIFLDWYEFSCAIPKFKKALLKNQMVLKYHVSINMKFWDKLYDSEGIPKDDKKKRNERKNAFLQQLNDFLSGEENAGKSFVSHSGMIRSINTRRAISSSSPWNHLSRAVSISRTRRKRQT